MTSPAGAEDEPEAPEPAAEAPPAPRIHVPDSDLGEEGAAESEQTPSQDGAGPSPAAKKRARRGSRGGRGRKKKAPAAGGTAPEESAEQPEANGDGNWEYVPMSEWETDLAPDSKRA